MTSSPGETDAGKTTAEPENVDKNSENVDKNSENVDKNSEYYKRNVLPVDRGWAWAVCFGGFLTYLMFGFSNQTMVILFVELIDKFETTITTASLIFMFGVLSVSLMSLIATNIIAPRIGERKVVFFGGIVFALGSIGYFLSPNIAVFLCFAVVKGLAGGTLFVPSISLIRHYFHKRRSIAQIIANTGQSVAAIMAPPIIRAVRKEYGISGSFLILAGLELHIMIAGLLLRPVEAYKFRPVLPPIPRRGRRKGKDTKTNQNQNGEAPTQLPSGSPLTNGRLEDAKIEDLTQEENPDRNYTDSGHQGNTSVTEKLLDDQEGPAQSKDERTVFEVNGQLGVANGEGREKYTGADHYASALSLVSEAAVDQIIEEAVSTEDGKKEKKKLSQRCGYAFCRSWAFRLVLILTPFGAANLYMKNYIPTITKTQGATLDESALLLTIVGAVDLVSRLCVGLFADTHILRPSEILLISQICLGVLCQFIRFFTTFETMIIMSVILGIFIGTRISLLALLSIEVVGAEMMPQAFSIIATIGTLSAASMNPMFGAVAESSGNFVDVMHMVGVCFFIASALLLLLPLLKRVDKRRAHTAKPSDVQ